MIHLQTVEESSSAGCLHEQELVCDDFGVAEAQNHEEAKDPVQSH